MNQFKELFESELNEGDNFMKDADKVLTKFGFVKSKNSNKYHTYYFTSNDVDADVMNDEYLRTISVGYSDPKVIKEIDKALKPMLKKYKGSFNSLSGDTWEFEVNVGNIVDKV